MSGSSVRCAHTTRSQTFKNTTHFVTAAHRERRRAQWKERNSDNAFDSAMFRSFRNVIRYHSSRQRACTAASAPRQLSNESTSTSYSQNHKDVTAPFHPSGDQPSAIAETLKLLKEQDRKFVSLRGATGTGKTFVMSELIRRLNRPTLVLAPNKVLAAQLCSEFKALFPRNAVECVT